MWLQFLECAEVVKVFAAKEFFSDKLSGLWDAGRGSVASVLARGQPRRRICDGLQVTLCDGGRCAWAWAMTVRMDEVGAIVGLVGGLADFGGEFAHRSMPPTAEK
jgi:hypothetical protein